MTNAGVEPYTYGELVARALARASKLGSDEPEEQVTLTGKELVTLATAIETLVRERGEARKEADEQLEPRFRELHFGREGFSAEVTGKAVEATALAMVSFFKANGAENYIEMNLHDRDEPFRRYTVTVQKVGALSPADKVRAAEAEVAQVERERDEARELLSQATSPKYLASAISKVGLVDAEWQARAEAAEAEAAKLRETLRQILRCEYDGVGLNDCIDNAGKPYQSADLAKHIKSAEELLA